MPILYSAQHWNQHKDAFAWFFYRDPMLLKTDKMGYNWLKNDSRGSNQIKFSISDRMTFFLLNYVTKSAVFTTPWMTCQSVITFQRRKFQKRDYKIDQSIEFSQSTTYWVGELDNNELHCCLLNIIPYTWPFKIRWNGTFRSFKLTTLYATEILLKYCWDQVNITSVVTVYPFMRVSNLSKYGLGN